MIDAENEIFSTVATALRSGFTGIFVSGEYVSAPPTFPAVTLVEDDNSTFLRTLDSSGTEKHAEIMYTANIYSDKSYGKKSECKSIMATIDEQMFGLGFIRIASTPLEMPNTNKDIYRMVARYRAVISTDKIIYRR